MFFVILAAVLALTDLVIKYGIENLPDDSFPRDVPGLKGKADLRKVHNAGFPFGFLERFPKLVRMIPLVVTSAILGVFAWLLPKKGNTAEKCGLSFALAGAVSNLFDRFFRGYVVDYIHIRKKPFDRAVFNLADCLILLGSLIFAAVSAVREIGNFLKRV